MVEENCEIILRIPAFTVGPGTEQVDRLIPGSENMIQRILLQKAHTFETSLSSQPSIRGGSTYPNTIGTASVLLIVSR
jgi:hypothetical protein